MKKWIVTLLFLCFLYPLTAFAYNTPELHFEKTSGKYIYCNNPENISRNDLADTTNINAKFLMNNENLQPNQYAMFLSHYNHTEIMGSDWWDMKEPGFDIELDVLFKAREDTVVTFSTIGFEVPEKKEYWLGGKKYSEDQPIGCMNAWASYLKMPLHQKDSGECYQPSDFTPITIELKAGEEYWMSDCIPNYTAVELYRAVHLISDFEIVSGACDVNVAALKSNGTLGDRSTFNRNALFGSYKRDRQYKGIADSLNRVTANVDYTIDYNVYHGMPLPIRIFNQKYPDGNTVSCWHTHYNPASETYDSSATDESNMLGFDYADDSKLKFYGSNVNDAEKDAVWHFDTRHNDLSAYIKGCGNKSYFKPNTNDRYYGVGYDHCNLGNYGVFEDYSYSLTNTCESTRYACYKLKTGSNNIVIVYDENGAVMPGYPICKGYTENGEEDTMACITLPPHKTTKFKISVILTTNYNGDMAHSLVIKTEPEAVETYESGKQYVRKDYRSTGKEFYKWENRDLYLSEDTVHWNKVDLEPVIKNTVIGRWKEYSFLYTGEGYVMYTSLLGGMYFYTPQKRFTTLYYLDQDFKLQSEYKFLEYPSALTFAKGIYYADTGAVNCSDNGTDWKLSGSGITMPVYNYGRYSASCKEKTIQISTDGINYYPIAFENFSPQYIDSYAGIYYYIRSNQIFVSYDGVYWQEFECDEKINSLYAMLGSVTVNQKYTYSLPPDLSIPVVIADGRVIGYENLPYCDGDTLMVPLQFTEKLLNSALPENIKTTVKNGVEYIPLRSFAEQSGYSVIWENATNTAFVTKAIEKNIE